METATDIRLLGVSFDVHVQQLTATLIPLLGKRGMGAIVNPLRSSVKTVGSMVKNVPENIFDGLRDGLVRVMRSKPSEQLEDNSKVGAGIDVDVDDNIPFRILLLLMDEVFDLKTRNTWLR